MFVSGISRLGSTASGEASGRATQAGNQVMHLRREVDRLLMITEALWEIVRDREGLTDEQLIAKIDEIDMRDGAIDGQRAKEAPTDCSSCGRTLARRQPVCIYCGTDAENRDPFTL